MLLLFFSILMVLLHGITATLWINYGLPFADVLLCSSISQLWSAWSCWSAFSQGDRHRGCKLKQPARKPANSQQQTFDWYLSPMCLKGDWPTLAGQLADWLTTHYSFSKMLKWIQEASGISFLSCTEFTIPPVLTLEHDHVFEKRQTMLFWPWLMQ